jgi:putative transposase
MTEAFSQPDDLGLWRFGIISPLLHCSEDEAPLSAQIKSLAQRTFYTPDGREKQICADTIRDWLCKYRSCGIDGLRNRPRKDRGTTAIPEKLQLALIDLRKNQPHWTIIRLLRHLRDQGHWNGSKPGKSALYRFAASCGLGRDASLPPTPVRSFEYPFFGDLWSGDFLHGPQIRRGQYTHKAYLHAIIDDATRYIVVARFHLAEDTRSLLDDLMLALRRFGIPKRLYTDNGAAFRSRHLRMVAARLGVSLPHTPPYMPRGRGKIERFFRSVREGFLTGRERTSIEKLNADLAIWINQYHHSTHSALGISPLQRKLTDKGPELKQIAATHNIDEIFYMEHTARVASDGCVRMFKKRFEIPHAIPGSAVTIHYLPWDEDCIFIGPQSQAIKPLDSIRNALRFDKPRRGKIAASDKENR